MIILRNKEFSWFKKILKKLDDRVNDRITPTTNYEPKKWSVQEISNISRQHKIALQIQKEAGKYEYEPEWRDPDYFPYFYVGDIEDYNLGNIHLGLDGIMYPEYEWNWEGKYFEKNISGTLIRGRVGNLKQDILKELGSIKEYFSKNTKNMYDEEEIEGVLTYLDHLIDIIKKSSL